MSSVVIVCAGLWLGAASGIIRELIHNAALQRPAQLRANDAAPGTGEAPRRLAGGLWAAEEEIPTNGERDAAVLARAGNSIGAIYLWQLHTGGSFHAARAAVAGLDSGSSARPRPRDSLGHA